MTLPMTQQNIKCCESHFDSVEVIVQSIISLSFAQSEQEIAAVAKTAARKLASADGAAFVFSEGHLCHYADEDAIGPLWKGKRFPKDNCISGWSMNNKTQVAIADIYADERIPHDAYKPTFVKSLLMTPVRKSDPIAAIGTYWAHHHTTSEEQAGLLQAFADVTAIAVQNVQQMKSLESQVMHRTEELSQSRDELQQLAYNVSHELQEPLRTMSANLRLLSVRYRDTLGGDAERFITTALVEGTRVERMLDALWMFARVDKGKSIVAATSAEHALENALMRLRDVIETSGASITSGPLPFVQAHPAQLEYLLQELIENSLKFARGVPSITISAHQKDDAWIFSVEDNGIGFDMIDGNRVFEMFQRLDRSRPGIGMGLAVCKRIVDAHRGSIWIQSRKGEGTTVYFTLPNGERAG